MQVDFFQPVVLIPWSIDHLRNALSQDLLKCITVRRLGGFQELSQESSVTILCASILKRCMNLTQRVATLGIAYPKFSQQFSVPSLPLASPFACKVRARQITVQAVSSGVPLFFCAIIFWRFPWIRESREEDKMCTGVLVKSGISENDHRNEVEIKHLCFPGYIIGLRLGLLSSS